MVWLILFTASWDSVRLGLQPGSLLVVNPSPTRTFEACKIVSVVSYKISKLLVHRSIIFCIEMAWATKLKHCPWTELGQRFQWRKKYKLWQKLRKSASPTNLCMKLWISIHTVLDTYSQFIYKYKTSVGSLSSHNPGNSGISPSFRSSE